jgi:two-component system chemotaxis response regulator CheB
MIRVLIVDDSAFNRVTLAELLDGVPDLKVVGSARDGYDAIKCIKQSDPHIITLDLEMPGMDGLSLLRWVMAEHPLPVVVVTSRESNVNLFDALELGALDFVLKPGRVSPQLPGIRDELVAKLRQVARCRPRLAARIAGASHTAAAGSGGINLPAVNGDTRLLAMVASTGGTQALQRIVSELPADFRGAVAVVQHMPAAFTGAFAQRLDERCALPVREARQGDLLRPGEILLAPGGHHLRVEGRLGEAYAIRLETPAGRELHVPSGDILLASAARVAGSTAAGFVLTGMGSDGTAGLAAMKEAGAVTVAESERSAVVFGMPRNAIAAGTVDRVVALAGIAPLMCAMTEQRRAAACVLVQARPEVHGRENT